MTAHEASEIAHKANTKDMYLPPEYYPVIEKIKEAAEQGKRKICFKRLDPMVEMILRCNGFRTPHMGNYSDVSLVEW